MTGIKYNYPNFKPQIGNLTIKFRNEFIQHYIDQGILSDSAFSDKKISGLLASNNPKDEIYFWQLYSIIGSDPIHILIKKFYENIFNDYEAPWFRDEFMEIGSIDYHVKGQKKFWLDVMGGGKHYEGGEKKLNIKHKMVDNIMTKEGAERWMFNMEKTMLQLNLHFIHDRRILPCIDKFLKFFMKKYSIEFDFNLYEIVSKSRSNL